MQIKEINEPVACIYDYSKHELGALHVRGGPLIEPRLVGKVVVVHAWRMDIAPCTLSELYCSAVVTVTTRGEVPDDA